jgi:hypothetical protein
MVAVESRCRRRSRLKLDLFSRRTQPQACCHSEQGGVRKILHRYRRLGAGGEGIRSGGLSTKIPVTQSFARPSPYVVHNEGGT